MTDAVLLRRERMLELRWPDGQNTRFPLIWLRDNDPADLHPDTMERTFDLLSVPDDLDAHSIDVGDTWLEIGWTAPTGSSSRFQFDWLQRHRPGTHRPDPAAIAPVIWTGDLGASGVPRAPADPILNDDSALLDWLTRTQATGLSIVTGLADTVDAGMAIARRIGHLRETNFGVTFEVESKPNPNNLAYTPVALPMHTDLCNQELPPGFQFLHCLANEAAGGGSLFADGYALANDLRQTDPAAFSRLCTTEIPFRFHDATHDIRCRKPVISLGRDGAVDEICYNAHLADVPDLGPDETAAFYTAYRALMRRTRDARFIVTLKLRAGEMAVFDNRRVLHGRDAFDPATGRRHLHGCYVDRGEFHSRIRVLSRDRAEHADTLICADGL